MNPASVPTTSGIQQVALSDLHPSPRNRRHLAKDECFRNLCESIRARGVLQPIKARVLPDNSLEIVYGQSRWEACRALNLATIPCTVVRSMSDEEAQQERLIENAQRTDLHPLDEAEMYSDLAAQIGVNETAAKIGKDVGHVYRRLALCGLVSEAKEAYRTDRLLHAVAPLVARIPHPDMQRKALDAILYHYDQPCPVTAAIAICARFQLPLWRASFDTKVVLAESGPCTECPKRTGNEPNLFGDVEDENVCTDPSCWEARTAADYAQKAADVQAAGGTILDEKTCAKLWPYVNAVIDERAGWIDLDGTLRVGDKQRTYRQVIGAKALKTIPQTLGRDPTTGSARLLVRVQDALPTLVQAGAVSKQAAQEKLDRVEGRKLQDPMRAQQKQELAERKVRRAVLEKLPALLLASDPEPKTLLMAALRGFVSHTGSPVMLEELGAKTTAEAVDLLSDLKPESVPRFLALAVVVNDGDPFGDWHPGTAAACSACGVSLADLEREIREEKANKKKGKKVEEKSAVVEAAEVAPIESPKSKKREARKTAGKKATKSPAERKPRRKPR